MKSPLKVPKIPDSLTTIVLADGKPLPGLLILVSLEMTRKNAFNMVFGPSDKEGKVEVSKTEIENEVTRTLDLFPMDYEGLSSFKGKLIVGAMGLEQVESALGAYQLHCKSAAYPSGYGEKLATARAILERLEAKRLDVKVTVSPRNGSTRIVTRSAVARLIGNRLRRRSG